MMLFLALLLILSSLSQLLLVKYEEDLIVAQKYLKALTNGSESAEVSLFVACLLDCQQR